MNRCSFCEWIPILPLPVWPLAGQCRLGQNTVVGSMPCSSWLCVEAYQEEYVGSLFSLQVSFATVKGSATQNAPAKKNLYTPTGARAARFSISRPLWHFICPAALRYGILVHP